ncbi:MAG: RNA polymerase sigma factor [Bacteroidota bacterium]
MHLNEITSYFLDRQQKLYRFALRLLGSDAEAEDVVQEVFEKVWRKRQQLGHIQNLEAWCMRVVKNISLDKLKAAQHQPHAEVADLPLPSAAPTPDETTAQQDMMEQLNRFIEQLPVKQRMVLQLRDIEGYSYQEIADIMEVSMNQVKVSLFRARKALKEALTRQQAFGVNLTSTSGSS